MTLVMKILDAFSNTSTATTATLARLTPAMIILVVSTLPSFAITITSVPLIAVTNRVVAPTHP